MIEKPGAVGFTLIELAVVIATVAVLAALLLPALAGTRPNTQAFQCLGNQRQLILAWQMYAQDNSDILPPNDYPYTTAASDDGTIMNWVFGSMYVNRDVLFGPRYMADPRLTALARYNTNSAVYRCPMDTSLNHGIIRPRSVSMNSAVGTRWYSAGMGTGAPSPNPARPPGSAVGGGWLVDPYNDLQTTWHTYGKITQMTRPGPAMTWIIMDENPQTINDGSLIVCMQPLLVDYPANYHNGGAGISFADGHAEVHKWLDAFVNPNISGATGGPGYTPPVAPDPCQDLAWIQPRTTAHR